MPPRIYTHSVLEAAVCEAKLRDALLVRYGKSGPARQGQLGHHFAAGYLSHLNRTKQSTDFEAGVAMWSALRHQATAEDERAVEDSIQSFIFDNVFTWVSDADELAPEAQRYFTVPDRVEVPWERVMDLDCPVFRVTPDLVWRGQGPIYVDRNGGSANVLDWKWHRTIEHVTAPDQNRQLLRYASALFGPEEQDVAAFLGFPRKSYYEATVFTPEQRESAWRDLVVAAIADAERLLSTPSASPDRCVGPHCRDCDLRRGCDAALRYPFDLVYMEAATPQERVTALQLVTALRNDMLKEARLLAADSGPIDDGDWQLDIGDEEHLSFDRDTITRVLGPVLAKDDIERCFKATKTQTLKVLTQAGIRPKQREELISIMRVTGDRKLNTKVKVTRVKKERPVSDVDGDGEP